MCVCVCVRVCACMCGSVRVRVCEAPSRYDDISGGILLLEEVMLSLPPM